MLTLVMLHHITLKKTLFYTHHNYMKGVGSLCFYHCAREDVSSGNSDHCRTYYKHCKRTDALQYVSVDVSSDYSYHKTPYHKLYMGTETAVCVFASDS